MALLTTASTIEAAADAVRRGVWSALPALGFARFARGVRGESGPGWLAVRGESDRAWTYLVAETPDAQPELSAADRWFAACDSALVDRLFSPAQLGWRSEGVTLRRTSVGNVSAPAGFRLTALEPHEASRVDAVWEYRSAGTEAMLRECIERFPSIAARDVHGALVGWLAVVDDGAMGAGFIEPAFRGRALYPAIVSALAARVEAAGLPVFLHLNRTPAVDSPRWAELGFERCGAPAWLEVAR